MKIDSFKETIYKVTEVVQQRNQKIQNKELPKDAEKVTKVAYSLLKK